MKAMPMRLGRPNKISEVMGEKPSPTSRYNGSQLRTTEMRAYIG
jgi:hypothetical protein